MDPRASSVVPPVSRGPSREPEGNGAGTDRCRTRSKTARRVHLELFSPQEREKAQSRVPLSMSRTAGELDTFTLSRQLRFDQRLDRKRLLGRSGPVIQNRRLVRDHFVPEFGEQVRWDSAEAPDVPTHHFLIPSRIDPLVSDIAGKIRFYLLRGSACLNRGCPPMTSPTT